MCKKYEFCMKYANTMMMMAKALEKQYGKKDSAAQSYAKEGAKSCKMAIQFQKEWDADSTNIIYVDFAA